MRCRPSKPTSTEPCCSVPLSSATDSRIAVADAAERHAVTIEQRTEAGVLDAGWLRAVVGQLAGHPDARVGNGQKGFGVGVENKPRPAAEVAAMATSAPSRRET